MIAIDYLATAFSGRLLTDAEDMVPFLTDWRGLWTGRARAVAQPDTPNDVARVVRWCAAHRVAVVPQGGNTGLSGGATPDDSGTAIVLSLARLNRVRGVDTVNDTITLDAGCILQHVQETADANDRLFPLSLAAGGTCTIGGNLAANAGGTSVLRYGSARALCLGIEVVTASGDIWDGLLGLRKDNSGYDLRDLFIGSEGTLGVITGAVLKLFPKPRAKVAAFVAVASPGAALALFARARAALDTAVTAFELLSETCLAVVLEHVAAARRPLETRAPWYLLIELTDQRSEDAARADLETLLAAAHVEALILDAAIAGSIAQSRAFWGLREGISEAQGAAGKTIKHDLAVPISRIADFLIECDAAVASRWPDLRFVTFGHLGDGNLHYNFSASPGADQAAFLARQDAINALVHDLVRAHGGSISAEHGLGVLRRDEAARFRSPVEDALMRAIKQALDPLGIMNPGKLLALPDTAG
ncbi:FAD-binding oxidoreductase [Sphingomonas sp.]|uniref:FAD-binding oxidoreductase n=1 Tax=Sphingomonas sp. TaxID=28214 RepID=UPI003D6D1781